MRRYSALSIVQHLSSAGNEHMDNSISTLDKTCDEWVSPSHTNSANINDSVERSQTDAFIEQMVDFIDLIGRNTGLHTAEQLISLFENKQFNNSLLSEKLQNILERRKVAAQNTHNMFLTNVFEEIVLNTSLNYRTTACTTMYVWDCAKAIKNQETFFPDSEDFLFRPIGKSLKTDGTIGVCDSPSWSP